jgi:hypothetical protein
MLESFESVEKTLLGGFLSPGTCTVCAWGILGCDTPCPLVYHWLSASRLPKDAEKFIQEE